MIAESRIRRAGRTLPAQPVAQPARRRRLGSVAALGAAAALILAGCSAGQTAQTAEQHSTVGGASGDIGSIALRNVQLSAPDSQDKRWQQGSNVPVEMSIINNAREDDQLVSASSDAASSVAIFKDKAAYLAYLGTLGTSAPSAAGSGSGSASSSGSPTASPSASASATPSATASPTSSAAPSANGTATAAPSAGGASATSTQVTIPTAGSVRFGGPEDGPVMLLVGLKQTLGGGQTVTLSFTFATAGSTTVVTPIDLTEGGYSNAPTVPVHGNAEGEH